MTKIWKGKRILSLVLALAMVMTMMPSMVLPAYSEESITDYSQYVGYYAQFSADFPSDECFFVLSDEPTVDWPNNQMAFWQYEFSEDILFEITDYKIVTYTYEDIDENGQIYEITEQSLWYQVSVVDGTVPVDEATGEPVFQDGYWIMQNYLNAEDRYDYDVLSLTQPAEDEVEQHSNKVPASIVSANGITVSSNNAELTELVLTASENVPQDYYINRAVSYEMTLRTATGSYTDYATVTIPIPDGWDVSKVFGFVVEDDGSLTIIPGTVTKQGTFCFTVPHFSDVGLLEARSLAEVTDLTITMTAGQSSPAMEVTGTATDGTYTSDDECVEYVIKTHNGIQVFTALGVMPTNGTYITVGSTTYTVIVKTAAASVNKFLTSGNSATLDALYDLSLREGYNVSYILSAGDTLLQLEQDGVITASDGGTGTATVTATVTHQSNGLAVGVVTYNVTVSNLTIASAHNVYVPVNGTVSITGFSSILEGPYQSSIATATHSGGTLAITGVSEGSTAMVVKNSSNENVLLNIYVNPDNASNNTTKAIYVKVSQMTGCQLYYAINGGALWRVDGAGVLIGLDSTTQSYPDGFNIMIFSKPLDGLATTEIAITLSGSAETNRDFYSLANGVLYDGSDSDAWPFNDPYYAGTIPTTGDNSAWVAGHGFRWCLMEGNMTIAEMRDLFARAIALGCDSALTFTKNASEGINIQEMGSTAELLPAFELTGVKYKLKDQDGWEDYNDTITLKIGDIIQYIYTINVASKNIDYSNIQIVDSQTNGTETLTSLSSGSTIVTMEYTLDEKDIAKYANGEFYNRASFSYNYSSDTSSGTSKTEKTVSVKVNVQSIITWTDSFGNIWKVQTKTIKETITEADAPDMTGKNLPGYTLYGWLISDGNYPVDSATSYIIQSTDSITINAQWAPEEYIITYNANKGTMPDTYTSEYTIETMLALPTPTYEGHTFTGWKPAADVGNWKADRTYNGTVTGMYGEVTLIAQWEAVSYQISYDLDGGTLPVGQSNPGGYNAGAGLTLISPVKAGYLFAGWQVDKVDTNTNWVIGTVYNPGIIPAGMYGNVTLKALWTPQLNDLTIQVNYPAGADYSSEANQTFIFEITEKDSNAVIVTVVVEGAGDVTISGLTIDKTYVVTMKSDWSWRFGTNHTNNAQEVRLSAAENGDTVVFEVERTITSWLDANWWGQLIGSGN